MHLLRALVELVLAVERWHFSSYIFFPITIEYLTQLVCVFKIKLLKLNIGQNFYKIFANAQVLHTQKMQKEKYQ